MTFGLLRKITRCGISAVAALASLAAGHAHAHTGAPPDAVRAQAVRRTSELTIDGRLDDAAWAAAPVHGGFVQRYPNDAARPSFETRFAVLYDDEAVFVGVWADDPHPEQIRALLTRRDVDAPADGVTVAFDSYHDRRTAYAFQLSAAGVQRDVLMFDDTHQDGAWDAVWSGDAAVTATGWTAEYRIPLSQLRFSSAGAPQWGLQVVRKIGRTGEEDAWSPWPRSAPQVVSRFGVVEGIAPPRDQRRLELLPFLTGGLARAPIDAGDPLNQARQWRSHVGLDLKYGLGPAFTLSATIAPDFGQVGADPSRVNLSASELFQSEQRPFFLEGTDLFRLPIGASDGSAERAFHSRRIGAAPSAPDTDYDYLRMPEETTLYGAAKLTGKAGGWSIGALDAVTGEETATLVAAGAVSTRVVAPLTNFAVARVKRDANRGATSIGASATAVNRALAGTGLETALHDRAYSAGLQLEHRWADDAWTASASLTGSYVHGAPEAIAATQRSSRHYFQRPDATDVTFDPTRTSLAGLGARWMIGQLGDARHWRLGTGGDLRTPGLELNDAGFQHTADRIAPFAFVQYREDAPGGPLLDWQVSSELSMATNFEGRLLSYAASADGSVQLANRWSANVGGNLSRTAWSTGALRGGPALRGDASQFAFFGIRTDPRAALALRLGGYGGRTPASGSTTGGLDLTATAQARSNLDLSIGSGISVRDDAMQYIAEAADQDGAPHYVFGRVREASVSLTMRLNWTFSPTLALQAYAQPYLASGRYRQLKDVDQPAAAQLSDRFTPIDAAATLVDGTYEVARDSGARYSFARPDFNFRQLRATMVLRWDYRPGSTVFAIWNHGQTSDALADGDLAIGRDLGSLGRAASSDSVMVKANYWFGL